MLTTNFLKNLTMCPERKQASLQAAFSLRAWALNLDVEERAFEFLLQAKCWLSEDAHG